MRRAFGIAIAVLLLATNAWLLWPRPRADAGLRLEPARLELHVGEMALVRIVNLEADAVALGFRLRFDADVITIGDVQPALAELFAGGQAIVVPPRPGPGELVVPGIAVSGGRVFEPGAPVYTFTIRAFRAGTTLLRLDDAVTVDLGERERRLPAATAQVHVRTG